MMEPSAVATIIAEVYKVGGGIAVMFLCVVAMVVVVYRDTKSDKKNLVKSLADCQKSHTDLAVKSNDAINNVAHAMANSNHVLEGNTKALDRVCRAITERYDQRDPSEATPPHGHRS